MRAITLVARRKSPRSSRSSGRLACDCNRARGSAPYCTPGVPAWRYSRAPAYRGLPRAEIDWSDNCAPWPCGRATKFALAAGAAIGLPSEAGLLALKIRGGPVNAYRLAYGIDPDRAVSAVVDSAGLASMQGRLFTGLSPASTHHARLSGCGRGGLSFLPPAGQAQSR